jgi:hypothetical protein
MNSQSFADQANRLVTENQNLRVKSDNDDKTIYLMKEQYDGLSSSVEAMRNKHDREMHTLRTERDRATRAFKEIDTVLLQAADLIMQALRARQGDGAPEQIPERPMALVNDSRLPTPHI